MLRQLALACALATLLVCPAWGADTILSYNWSVDGCTEWTLCNDQTSGTTCVTGADNNIIRTGTNAEWFWSAWGDSSDQTTGWTADVYQKTRGAGHGTVRAHLTHLGSLTPTNPVVHWSGHGGDIHAVLGGTLTNGVTIKVQGCVPSAGSKQHE